MNYKVLHLRQYHGRNGDGLESPDPPHIPFGRKSDRLLVHGEETVDEFEWIEDPVYRDVSFMVL